jgi:hypothetical protein
MFVMAFLCFGLCLFTAIPDRVDTMLSPLRSLLDVAELANQSHSLLVLLVFCLVFLLFFCLLFVCGCFALYRSMPVQLLRLFSIAYVNASSQFIFLQHAIERVKRPGESQEALRKKGRLAIWQQQNVGFQRMCAQWP